MSAVRLGVSVDLQRQQDEQAIEFMRILMEQDRKYYWFEMNPYVWVQVLVWMIDGPYVPKDMGWRHRGSWWK